MKTQAKSALVICEYCNKQVRKRGLVSHIRLQHKIQVIKPQPDNSVNLDYGKALKELHKILKSSSNKKKIKSRFLTRLDEEICSLNFQRNN